MCVGLLLLLLLWDRAVPGLRRGGGICRGTDTWGLLPVGGSVWFTLSWLMLRVFAVDIVDIRELAG